MRYALLLVLAACQPHVQDQDSDTAWGELPRACSLPWPPPRPIALERRWAEMPMVAPTMLRRAPEGWLLLQRDGELFALDEDPASSTPHMALDLRDRMFLLRDTGATSFVLSPDFETDGLLYVVYSTPGGTMYTSRLSRFHRDADAPGLVFDPASEEILFEQDQYNDLGFHAHGDLAFGPDGMLYLGLGDGGPHNDPLGHAQDPTDLWGSILRIDVGRADPGRGYAIPPDNPFASGQLGAPETWAWGFRNPFRFAFDPATGDLFAGDIGHITREEIDLVERGKNYGWPIWEGTRCRDPGLCHSPLFAEPIADYGRSLGGMVVGGFVYRGSRLPDLVGRYIFADFVTGLILAVDPSGGEPEVLGEAGQLLIALAVDADGELLVVSMWGAVYDLVPSAAASDPDFPRRLSETGCVDPEHPGRIAGLLPYEVNVPLWSDAAHKDRWLSLPEGEPLAVTDEGKLVLPPGAVAVKRFERDGRFVETRLFARHLDGTYAGYTYAWDFAQSDAVLIDTYDDFASWSYLPAPWAYPTRGQCMQCHNEAAGSVLGLEQAQLDREVTDPDGNPVNQLDAWAAAGLLVGLDDVRPDPLPNLGTVEAPERARAWLHVNCAICHRPEGPTPAAMDLRVTTPLSATGVCDVVPADPRGLTDPRLVAPGDPDRSVLLVRIEEGSMPPIGHRFVDPVGRSAVRTWIAGLDDCSDP